MEIPALDEKKVSFLAVALAAIGLFGLYFFSQNSTYEKVGAAYALIAEDGARVQIGGIAQSVEEKERSSSIKLCDERGDCVSISAAKNAQVDYPVLKGDGIVVFGQVASYKWAKFIRAEKIIHSGG